MYLFDLFANIFRKKNFGVLLWLIINTVIVTLGFAFLIDVISEGALDLWLEILLGFVAYAATMAVALSPVGEAILRWQNGCRKITDEETLSRLSDLFEEVREKSVEFDKSLNRNIRFYMSEDEAPNAFATGRKTVCVTKGLLALSDNEIKGVLAHEFGHLSHKDTDVILVVAVGNMFVALGVAAVSLIVRIFNWVLALFISLFAESERGGFIIGFLTSKFNALVSLLFGAVLWLWTKLGVLICMSSSRQNEFHADKFASDIGFGSELRSALVRLDGGEKVKSKGLWAALSASHPDTDKRIEMLDSYGVVPVNSETGKPVVGNDRFAMLRGFSSSFENNTAVKDKEPVAQVRRETAPQPVKTKPENFAPVKTESPKPRLPLKFHKVNLWIFIPLAVISAVVDLVTRGIVISEYGLDVANVASIITSFAIAIFSVSAFFEFRRRNPNAFVATMVTRVASFLSFCVVAAESLFNSPLYGFEYMISAIFSVLTTIFSAISVYLVYIYYNKRKDILFDTPESIK